GVDGGGGGVGVGGAQGRDVARPVRAMSATAAHTPEGPRDPIAAVTHSDPYPYYAQLVATRPFHRDDTLGLWVACSAAAVTDVLGHPACRVRPPSEPVPRPLPGSA